MLKTGTAARRIFSMRRTAKRRSAFWLAEGTSHGVFDAEDSLVRFACLTDQVWQIFGQFSTDLKSFWIEEYNKGDG
jgi:hypothetical protein